jgi:hypothetical protein
MCFLEGRTSGTLGREARESNGCKKAFPRQRLLVSLFKEAEDPSEDSGSEDTMVKKRRKRKKTKKHTHEEEQARA